MGRVFVSKGDRGIWVTLIILAVLSLLVVYSSTGTLAYKKEGGDVTHYLLNQLFSLALGFFVLFIASKFPSKFYAGFFTFLYILGIALLLFTVLYGSVLNSAKRSVQIPFFNVSMQTFEIAKVATIGYLSRVLCKHPYGFKSFKETFLKLFVPLVVATGLIVTQNLSTALLLFISGFFVFFVGRVNWKHLLLLGAITIGGFILFFAVLKMMPPQKQGRLATWQSRIENFRNPEPDPDKTYQITQSKIAIATGGLSGKLPGKSTQRNFLPHPYSDFIYAIIIEEYGAILGGLGVLMLYLIILFRGFRIALKANTGFGTYYAAGITFLLVFQALINMGVAVDLLPVTGQPLPLVSMGGTSIVVTSFAFGVLLSISRDNYKNQDNQPATETNGEEEDE